MTSPKISHRVIFVYEREKADADIYSLAEKLEKVIKEGESESEVPAFGSLRTSLRQDTNDKVNVSIIASFDFALDAKKLPASFEENELFWNDPRVWHGFKCVSVNFMAVIPLLFDLALFFYLFQTAFAMRLDNKLSIHTTKT